MEYKTMVRRRLYISMMLACFLLGPVSGAEQKSIGAKPPEWEVTDWIHTKPLTLRELTGKVVLIRWWTAPDCPYCIATAPALNEFYEEFKDHGLVVIGFYHHKTGRPLDSVRVKDYAEKLGFRFPVATDRDWKTLRRWWLQDSKKDWTSVSFLLDRQGVIRHIHPGGKYVQGDEAYETLKAKVTELLREK
jgi:peroxiredoxin